MKRVWIFLATLILVAGIALTVSAIGTFRLAVVPLREAQTVVQVDTTNQYLEAGVDKANFLRFFGAATTVAPEINAAGSDTNVSLNVEGKGTGSIRLASQLANYWNFAGAAAGSGITMTATGSDTNIDVTITPKGTGKTVISGAHTDGWVFYPAYVFARSDNANLVVSRVAANDWALTRTAAGAETYNIIFTLPLEAKLTASKGTRIDNIAVVYQVTVVALTTHTLTNIASVTYANNTANAVAAWGGTITGTPATAVQANPYVTTLTLGTPAYMVTDLRALNVEFQVVMANTGVYRLYGVGVHYTTALY